MDLTCKECEYPPHSKGLCAGCLQPSGRNLAVDHDHSCCPGNYSCGLCVRGLLCSQCNTALGMVGDSPSTLARLVSYLHQPTQSLNP